MSKAQHLTTDYLIVGQGLAGSLLAWQLIQLGYSVRVIDNTHSQSSSMAAAGLINPISGKRLTSSPLTNDYRLSAEELYLQLESHFQQKFYHPKPLLRLIKDNEQQQYLQKRLQKESFASMLTEQFDAEYNLQPFRNTHGAIVQQHSGYLDIPAVLSVIRDWLKQKHQLIEAAFNYQELLIQQEAVSWKQQKFGHVIFCEGHQLSANPWFNWLPLQKAKGDILTVSIKNCDNRQIINRGHWLLPIGGEKFKTGASSYWQFSDDLPEPAQAKLVEQRFKELFESVPNYKINAHQAGIRPASRDKMPFIGRHPEFSALLVFNGFGAHGSLMMPYYSNVLIHHLLHNSTLPDEVNIHRYWQH